MATFIHPSQLLHWYWGWLIYLHIWHWKYIQMTFLNCLHFQNLVIWWIHTRTQPSQKFSTASLSDTTLLLKGTPRQLTLQGRHCDIFVKLSICKDSNTTWARLNLTYVHLGHTPIPLFMVAMGILINPPWNKLNSDNFFWTSLFIFENLMFDLHCSFDITSFKSELPCSAWLFRLIVNGLILILMNVVPT